MRLILIRLGLEVEIVAGWAEADRGASRYRSIETLRAEGAEAWTRFRADPIRYMGADPAEFRAAVLGALQAPMTATRASPCSCMACRSTSCSRTRLDWRPRRISS